LVYFGFAPLIDQEDLLQFLNLTNLQIGSLNITLRGLPNLPNFGGGNGLGGGI